MKTIVIDRKTLVSLLVSLVFIVVCVASMLGAVFGYESKNLENELVLGDEIELSIKAYVSGGVEKPGVYMLTPKDSFVDLIEEAGGFTIDADFDFIHKSINLAQYVQNEDHLYIPFVSELKVAPSLSEGEEFIGNNSDRISINNGSENELVLLPGIGEVSAKKIIDARPYSSIEDLREVDGIGDSKFEKIENLISI